MVLSGLSARYEMRGKKRNNAYDGACKNCLLVAFYAYKPTTASNSPVAVPYIFCTSFWCKFSDLIVVACPFLNGGFQPRSLR